MSSISQIIVSNTKWLLLIGMFQKIIVFTMNQMVIAYSSPEVIGQISIQSELLLSTLLFLSREGIRIACLKYNTQSSSSNQQLLINLSWLPCLLVIIISILLGVGRSFSKRFASVSESSDSTLNTNNDLLFFFYCLAAFIECLGEPFYNYYQNQLYIQGPIQAETTALFVKSAATFIMIALLNWTKLSFGIAQIIYSVIYVLMLVRHVRSFQKHVHSMMSMLAPPASNSFSSSSSTSDKNKQDSSGSFSFQSDSGGLALPIIRARDFLPRGVKDEYEESFYFDYDLCKSAMMIMTSSVFKHALTEADKITLSFFCSNYEQGIYALTNNYGSLIARLLFLPIEDSMRISFARIATNLRDEIRQHYYSLKKSEVNISSNSLEAHMTTSRSNNSKGLTVAIPISTDSADNENNNPANLYLNAPTTPSELANTSNYSVALATKQISLIEKEKLKLSSLTIEIQKYYYYKELKQLFLFVIRGILYLGCIFSLFGPYYIELIMKHLLKSQWQVAEVYQTLQYYCYYLLLLGLNGITEAFLQSIVDQDSSYWSMNAGLVISFIVFFLVFLYTMVYSHGGTGGIVIANCFGMFIRILWNSYLIYDIFQYPVKEFLEFRGSDASSFSKSPSKNAAEGRSGEKDPNPMLQIVPSRSWVVLMFLVKVALAGNFFHYTRYTVRSSRDSMVFFGVGVTVGVIMLISSYFLLPRESRQQLIELVRGKRTVATKVNDKVEAISRKKD